MTLTDTDGVGTDGREVLLPAIGLGSVAVHGVAAGQREMRTVGGYSFG